MGLYILRSAWNAVDIFRYHARCYKWLTKFTYTVQLAIGLAVTTLTVLANNERDGKEILSEGKFRVSVIALSASSTVIAAINAFFSPQKRWLILRGASQTLESMIWKYRVDFGLAFKQSEKMKAYEKELLTCLEEIKLHVGKAGVLNDTAFFSFFTIQPRPQPWQDYIYCHGQYPNCSEDGQGPNTVCVWLLLVLQGIFCSCTCPRLRSNFDCCCCTFWSRFKKWCGGRLHSRVIWKYEYKHENGSGDRRATHSNDGCITHDERDDHHSPVTAERYISLRVIPMWDFYQRRMPRYNKRRIIFEAMLVSAAIASTFMAAFGFTNWTAIVASFAGVMTAWASFMSSDKKLTRYTSTVQKVDRFLNHWNQLPQIEKLMVSNIHNLVDGCEDAFKWEYNTWSSVGMAKQALLQKGGGNTEGDCADDLEAQKIPRNKEDKKRARNEADVERGKNKDE